MNACAGPTHWPLEIFVCVIFHERSPYKNISHSDSCLHFLREDLPRTDGAEYPAFWSDCLRGQLGGRFVADAVVDMLDIWSCRLDCLNDVGIMVVKDVSRTESLHEIEMFGTACCNDWNRVESSQLNRVESNAC